MRTTKARACDGKQRYDSKAVALAVRRRLIAGGSFAGRLGVYRCPHDDSHWHVGHKIGRHR